MAGEKINTAMTARQVLSTKVVIKFVVCGIHRLAQNIRFAWVIIFRLEEEMTLVNFKGQKLIMEIL